MSKIFIMGCGGMGTAIAVAMNAAGHDVTLWGFLKSENDQLREHRENITLLKGVEIPQGIDIVDTVEKAGTADVVIIATPTVGVRATVKLLNGIVSPNTPVACVSKGLEPKTLKTFDVVVDEELPGTPFVALSGPSHAEEIARGKLTILVAASKSADAARKIQDLTQNTQIRIYTSSDVLGVELGGALKNVIAFAAGIIDGMECGDNTKAALMTRGLTEIARLGRAMGAREETFAGLSGVGDLIVTCCSMHSRNRRCGMYVGEGMTVSQAVEKVGMTVEGITAALCAYELSQRLGVVMPITTQIYNLIEGSVTAKESIDSLLKRPLKDEIDSIWLEDN